MLVKCGYLWFTSLGLRHFGTLSVPNLEKCTIEQGIVTIKVYIVSKAYLQNIEVKKA